MIVERGGMEWCLIIKVMFSGGGGLCLVTQPLCSWAVLDDALQDEGGHSGVDHVVGHPALGQSGLLVFARVDIVSELRREERSVSQTLTVYLHYPRNYPGLLSAPGKISQLYNSLSLSLSLSLFKSPA